MLIEALKYKLQEGNLPGRQAQLAFANHAPHDLPSDLGKLLEISKDAIPAATLCLLFPDTDLDEKYSFALIERTRTSPDDPHSGQISFPGGRMELEDPSMQFTALREANEEIGVLPDQVEILGKLSDLFISVSNYIVSPYVGYIDYKPDFIPQLTEVNNIFTPSLDSLLNPSNILTKDIHVRGIVLKDMPYFNLSNKVVWGATAMMLSEFRTIVQQIK